MKRRGLVVVARGGGPGRRRHRGGVVRRRSLRAEHQALRADTHQPDGAQQLLDDRYGRIREAVAAPDDTLWLTTSNRDGRGDPTAEDDRIVRLLPDRGPD